MAPNKAQSTTVAQPGTHASDANTPKTYAQCTNNIANGNPGVATRHQMLEEQWHTGQHP
jgi:hypothetical protein